ncbi:hypothetical protein V6N12_072092 [Hibiscus sabdariffa]|uniref:Uncharacterized protein n=1 Tax=Hibiscus sabdariffa TaxID=183260 RepID=A0ABR2FMC4_9ROSI
MLSLLCNPTRQTASGWSHKGRRSHPKLNAHAIAITVKMSNHHQPPDSIHIYALLSLFVSGACNPLIEAAENHTSGSATSNWSKN